MVTEQSQRCTPTNTDCIKIQKSFLFCSIFPSFSSTETFVCFYILAHWMLVVGSKNENDQVSTPMHRKKSDFERLGCSYISQSVSYDFFSEWICWTLFECIHNPQILVNYIHTARLLMLLYEKNCIFILTHTNHTHTLYATNFRRKESWFIT